MSSKGKGKTQSQNSKPKSRSARSGLMLSVGRVHRYMREGKFARRIGGTAAIYLTAAIEYLCAEIMELAAKAASDNKRKRVSARDIMLAIRNDVELDHLLEGVLISEGGVKPSILAELLPKKTKKRNQPAPDTSSQEY